MFNPAIKSKTEPRKKSVRGVELMEPRMLLSAVPIQVGAVYIEEDLGSDQHGDIFQLTFQGGAEGTQLSRIIIDGNQNDPAFAVGDVFFDTQRSVEGTGQERFGADDAFDLTILETTGFDVIRESIADGGTVVELRFDGFDPGDKLVFSVDVDEVEEYDENESDVTIINDGFDPITSGVEFQGSSLIVDFVAPHYEDGSVSAEFRNRYDALLEGTGLDLPEDDFNGKRDRSAAAIGSLRQAPIPAEISGHVFHDRNQDGRRDYGEEGIGRTQIRIIPIETLEPQEPVTVTTDESGFYLAQGLAPGSYRIEEVQPDGYFDGLDSAGTVDGTPAGLARNPGDAIDSIFLGGGSQGVNYDFGELLGSSVQGRVQLATEDGDCFGDEADHAPVVGAVVQLLDQEGNLVEETTTDDNGEYAFTNLRPGEYSIVEQTPDGLIDGGARQGRVSGSLIGSLGEDRISAITLGSGQEGTNFDFCEIEPVSIAGSVHLAAANGDCFGEDVSHAPLFGVRVQLLNEDGEAVAETTTDRAGRYQFLDLAPGTYSIVEKTPLGYFEGGAQAGTIGEQSFGIVRDANNITSITLGSGQQAIDYDFCEVEPVSISGSVHLATEDGDCFGESREHRSVPGVTVQLRDSQGNVVSETKTDDSGRYTFLDLAPGTYSVVEFTPSGLLEGGAQAGTVDGVQIGSVEDANNITQVTLGPGQEGVSFDFCEVEPVLISGNVHLSDQDGNCFGDQREERPLSGVSVRLLDESGRQIAQSETDARGNYVFLDLPPGTYSVIETTPAGLFEGGAQVGNIGGASVGEIVDANTIAQIQLGPGQEARGVDFCEHEPSALSGFVYHDRSNDGQFGGNENPIEGVEVFLFNESGGLVQVALTSDDGGYQFEELPAGVYTIQESQPRGWLDGLDTPGTINGNAVGNADTSDQIESVAIGWGQIGVNFNFGERLPSSIQGNVHLGGATGDCFSSDVEYRPLENSLVQLLDERGQVVQETETDAAGDYWFLDVTPGNYSIRQFTLDGLLEGGAQAGSGGGLIADSNNIRDIVIDSDEAFVDYDFCDFEPASISGFVYHDESNEGTRDRGEDPIEGAVVVLYDEAGDEIARTQTDELGRYTFDRLPAGVYSIEEVQPELWFDGIDTVGTINGRTVGTAENPGDRLTGVSLAYGDVGVEYNFAEVLPASLSGLVHSDHGISNCTFDEERGDELLSNVRVELLDEHGSIVASTLTNELGRFEFNGLQAGEYSVREIQPLDYFEGTSRLGDLIDDSNPNLIRSISLSAGESRDDLAFCEDPPVELSGFVYQDGPRIQLPFGGSLPEDISEFRDGTLTPDDQPLAGVVVELRVGRTAQPFSGEHALPGFYADGVARAVTDENGFYEFTGLRKGTYAVYEFQPIGFIDGIDSGGTAPEIVGLAIGEPVAINQNSPISELQLRALNDPPGFDVVSLIQLPPGTRSTANNFSEVLVEQQIVPLLFMPEYAAASPFRARDVTQIELANFEPLELNPYEIESHGRSRGRGKTWHLSVIDGGTPRGEGEKVDARGPVWLTASDAYRFGWDVTSMDVNEWTVAMEGEELSFNFGVKNGIPIAGDFNGDGTSEIGVFFQGHWFIDINGNGAWDDEDLWAKLGHKGDQPVTGDWDGDGKDDIGIFGLAWPGDPRAVRAEPGLPDRQNDSNVQRKNLPPDPEDASHGGRTMQLAADGSARRDLIDHVFHFGGTGDQAVTGDWNGDGVATIGIFAKGRWRLDRNGDGQFTKADIKAHFGKPGDIAVAGDFNGDGIDDLGVYRDGKFYLDANNNRRIDGADLVVEVSRDGRPVVGDFNGDGTDEVAVVGRSMKFVEIEARLPAPKQR